MRVLVQLRSSDTLRVIAAEATRAPELTTSLSDRVAGLELDSAFPAVQVPGPVVTADRSFPRAADGMEFSFSPEDSTYLVRGLIPDDSDGQRAALLATTSQPDVVGVFSDPVIESCLVCPGDPPVGTAADVARLLDAPALAAAGMDGAGVMLAIVDTGINLAFLNGKGQHPKLDSANSWTPAGVTTTAGKHPVGHGTMCCFDAGILAPAATFLDDAVLLSRTPGATGMAGLLSDAVVAYSRLHRTLRGMPAAGRALIVSNSWGMFNPASDFPVGHPGNYSDNRQHPFNVIVSSIVSAGADVLFAAGNCGRDCPDSRCRFGTGLPVCGANSHPSVVSVAGIDTNKSRVGYSSQGPGRLSTRKPSLCGYTHFNGSGVFPGGVDGGTSAACPVLAGLVAAVRSRYPISQLTPFQLRSLLYKTAEDLAGTGYDFDYGWGVPNTQALLAKLP